MNIERKPLSLAPQSPGGAPNDVSPPLVSVIVTNHNYGRFLSSCLAGICAQSYVNIECIVVDDASSDHSCEVLDQIMRDGVFTGQGRSLQVIKLAVNAGMIGAACEGFKRSTGAYVIFFDADDIMLPQLVEAHVTAFFYCRIGVCISSTDMFYEQSGEIVRGGHSGFAHFINAHAGAPQPVFRRTGLPFSVGRDESAPLNLSPSELYHLPPDHKSWAWAATSALCFRREMVSRMLNRVPDIAGCLDAYLLRGIHPFTGALLIDRPLVAYRIHKENDWIKFPPIENFMNWDFRRELGVTRRIADEILKTYLLNAEFYANFLYIHDTYIQAIEWLYTGSDHWTTNGAPAERFSSKIFLEKNEARLKAAFGEKTYQRWLARYGALGQLRGFLRRLGAPRALKTLLRRCIGENRMVRLRAFLYG